MCDYHLRGNCFHPEKVDKGFVAISCDVHDCMHCTNKTWQNNKVREDLEYFQSILALANDQDEPTTTIISAGNQEETEKIIDKRFKNPFKLFSSSKKQTAQE